jgi:asparagine synthase (glutamine-hydrolysing)
MVATARGPAEALLPSEVMIAKLTSRLRNARAWALLSPAARRVRRQHLTYLSAERLLNLQRCARELDRARVPGDFIEAGVALGGSAILLARMAGLTPALNREFHGYDVFRMIPPPGDKDGDEAHSRYDLIQSRRSPGLAGTEYYGYDERLYEHVVERFEKLGLTVGNGRIHLHRGLFEETLVIPTNREVALAHVDCDWHDPVATCLSRVQPQLSVGGRIVVDDYLDYSGCRAAVHEFLAAHPEICVTSLTGNLTLTRRS